MDDSTREETQQAEKRAREEVLTILIIPLLIAGAIALSYAIGFVNTRPKILPPEQIPDPPQPVAEFLGIDTETGFGVADLLIRGANGEIYTYTWADQRGNKYFWQPASIPEEMRDFPWPTLHSPSYSGTNHPKNLQQISQIPGLKYIVSPSSARNCIVSS